MSSYSILLLPLRHLVGSKWLGQCAEVLGAGQVWPKGLWYCSLSVFLSEIGAVFILLHSCCTLLSAEAVLSDSVSMSKFTVLPLQLMSVPELAGGAALALCKVGISQVTLSKGLLVQIG